MSPQFWQIAAGDNNRDMIRLFLDWGIILNGPGDPGPWEDHKNEYRKLCGAQKFRDLERFTEEIKDGDIVVLRLGLGHVYGVGVIVGPYEWNANFGDVDGWDVQHVRRVAWVWHSYTEPMAFQSREMKIGTTQKLSSEDVKAWARRVINENKDWKGAAELPTLPQSGPKLIGLDDIGKALFDDGVSASSISETIGRIADIKRLAEWYWEQNEAPSESETIAHLVVPLLQTLGWTPQRMAVEWNNVDLALFDALPRNDEKLSVAVEVKRMDQACLSAKSQAEDYVLSKEARRNCQRLIVTDGMRYGVFIRQNEETEFPIYPDAYLNLQPPVHHYPILYPPQSSTNAPNNAPNGAARAMTLLSADLRLRA